jgi:site-specific DNA recombinase
VSLFERVQEVLGGKTVERKQSHEFLFRRHLSCAFCRKTLIPESQKGYTYYRCQSRGCPQKTVREELVEWSFLETLGLLRFNDCELDYLYTSLADSERTAAGRIEERLRSLKLRREQARDRLSRLTDAYMDGVLDREIYVMKKDDLLREEQVVGEKLLKVAEEERVIIKKVEELLERANNAYLTYKEGLFEDRRDLLKTTTSNFVVGHKNVSVKLLSPFRMIAERGRVPAGSPYRAVPRTLPLLLSQLFDYFKNVDLSTAQDSSRPMVVTRNDLPLAA